MSTVIISAILIIAIYFAVRSYRKKLASGCCGSASDPAPKKIRVQDQNVSHYSYAKVAQIDGMTCQNCAIHVQNALHALDDVFARVDLWKNEAVMHMKQDLPDGLLREIVLQAGYTVMSIRKDLPSSQRKP